MSNLNLVIGISFNHSGTRNPPTSTQDYSQEGLNADDRHNVTKRKAEEDTENRKGKKNKIEVGMYTIPMSMIYCLIIFPFVFRI